MILSSQKYDTRFSSRLPDPDFSPFRIPDPDPGIIKKHWIPDSGSATLVIIYCYSKGHLSINS